VRQPYVPRSVRIRGRQPAPDTESSVSEPTEARAADSTPAINFYAFEAQWNRHRQRPAERAALLKRIGAAALPALFRESLDAELVGSIIGVLSSELKAESAETVAFASSVLGALSRTQRFEASLEALSTEERNACQDVLMVLESLPHHSTEDLSALRLAFEPAPSLSRLGGEDEDDDEDDVPQGPDSSAPAPEVLLAAQAALQSSSVGETVAGVAEFSLDGCD